jgi:cytochrome c
MGRAGHAKRAAVLLAVLAHAGPAGCGYTRGRAAAEAAGGDPALGKLHIDAYGCGTCHTIANVPGAEGMVGPPLTDVAGRAYIAGRLSNSPGNMAAWIRDPKAVDEKTAMPTLGVSEQEARDITAFLYSIQE